MKCTLSRTASATAADNKRGQNKDNKGMCGHDWRTDSGFSSGIVDSGLSVDSMCLSTTESLKEEQNDLSVSPPPTLPQSTTNLEDSGLGLDEKFGKLSVDGTTTSTDKILNNLDSVVGHTVLEEESLLNRHQMIEEAFQPDKDGDTHLHLAIVHGRWDIISRLIQLAPDPQYLDCQNNLLQTPLHLAVLLGLPRVVRRLLLAGATLDVRNKLGNTALHLACERGDVECVRELLRPVSFVELDPLRRQGLVGSLATPHGAPQDLELRNYEGHMCIHLAALGRHGDVIQLLKLYGANVNAQDGKSGRTALCYAIEARDLRLMSFMVADCQASINEATYAGVTPFQLAYAAGTRYSEALLNLGVSPTAPVLSDSDSDYSSIEEGMDMDDDDDDATYLDLKINGEPFW